MDFLNKLTIEDLDDQSRVLADLIGFSNFKKIVNQFGGNYIYILKADSLTKKVRDKEIIKDFENGLNYKELSIKFNLSNSAIKNIIRDSFHHKRYTHNNQVSLFENEK